MGWLSFALGSSVHAVMIFVHSCGQCLISFIPGIDAQSCQGDACQLWKIQERAGKSTLSFALRPMLFEFDRFDRFDHIDHDFS